MDYAKPEVLVDSSVWIDFFRGEDTEEVERLRAVLERGAAGWSDMIQLEIVNHCGSERQLSLIRELRENVLCFHATPRIWGLAFELAKKARACGLSIPSTDLLIYATGVGNDLKLLHNDKHLRWLEEMG
jgi:predicted nucleic acid-binding protein